MYFYLLMNKDFIIIIIIIILEVSDSNLKTRRYGPKSGVSRFIRES